MADGSSMLHVSECAADSIQHSSISIQDRQSAAIRRLSEIRIFLEHNEHQFEAGSGHDQGPP